MTIARALETVADRIWQASWQASVLVVLVIVVQMLFARKLAPSARYGLWLLVVIRLLLPTIPESPFSLFNWVRFDSLPRGVSPIGTRFSATHEDAVFERKDLLSTAEPSIPANSEIEFVSENHASIERAIPFTWTRMLSVIWLSGAAIAGAILARHYRRLNSRLIDSKRVTESAVLRLFEEVRSVVGLKRSPTLLETRQVGSPALFGLFRCRLLLPKDLTASLTSRELRHVFLHEAAHLKRGDMLLNWVTALLQVLHWFNPVLWLGFSRMRADRELACDALALSYAGDGDGKRYARTIIKLLERGARSSAFPGLVGILEDKNQLKRRITMIAKFKKARRWSVWAVLSILTLGFVALTDAQLDQATDAQKETQQNTKSVPSVSPKNDVGVPRPPEGVEDLAASKSGQSFGMSLRRLIPPKFQGLSGPLAVSPNGEWLAIWHESRGTLLYNVESGTVRELMKANRGLSFSGDSSQVAVVRGKQLLTMDLDGSNQRTVFQDDEIKSLWLYAWSPDARFFAVEVEREANQYEFALISASTSSLKLLKSTGSREVGRAAFSPDSQFLAYDLRVDSKGSNSDLFVRDLQSGDEISVVEHVADDQLLGWSPLSNVILFTSTRRGSHDAWAIQFAKGNVRASPLLVKTGFGNATPLGFTKTGAFYFVLNQFNSDVYTLAIDPKTGKAKGAPVRSVNQFEGENSAPDWAPDGRHLAFNSSRSPSVLCVLDTDTHRERILGEGLYGPKWSPDGKSLLAFSEWGSGEEKIYKVDVATANRTVVVESKSDSSPIRCYDWAPDGQSIFFQYGNGSIMRRDLETGEEVEIHRVENGAFFCGGAGRSINCLQKRWRSPDPYNWRSAKVAGAVLAWSRQLLYSGLGFVYLECGQSFGSGM